MKNIIIAKWQEDVSWINRLPNHWKPIVITKDFDIPNVGREPHTYLWYIMENYYDLEGEYAFVQGNPFDHHASLIEDLDHHNIYGRVWKCDSNGHPHDNIDMHGFCDFIGYPEYKLAEYEFIVGCQYKLTAEQIKSKPLCFYEAFMNGILNFEKGPWCFERMAKLIHEI